MPDETPPPLRSLAISGSREYGNVEAVRAFVSRLDRRGWTVMTGDGPTGVDRIVKDECAALGLPYKGFPADWEGSQGRGAGLARNAEMVAEADWLVAFWDGNSRGCAHALLCAAKAAPVVANARVGKLWLVFKPNGEVWWNPQDLLRAVAMAKKVRGEGG